MFGQIRFLSNTHFLSQGIWHQMKELFREPHFSRNIHYRKNNFLQYISNAKPDLKPPLSFKEFSSIYLAGCVLSPAGLGWGDCGWLVVAKTICATLAEISPQSIQLLVAYEIRVWKYFIKITCDGSFRFPDVVLRCALPDIFLGERGQIYPCHVKIFLQKVENWIFLGPWHQHQRPEGLSIWLSKGKYMKQIWLTTEFRCIKYIEHNHKTSQECETALTSQY